MTYSYNPLSSLGFDKSIPLDGAGKIPSDYLPSYVDDVVEYDDLASFPGTGETGKIYVAKDTGYTYRWTGSVYVRIGSGGDVALNLGSEGSPSLYFTGDTDTGVYSPGAGQLAISTNGAQALYINADGDILVADGNRMEIDEIRARDGDGLKLYDDAGNGIFVRDGGNVGIGDTIPDAKFVVYRPTQFAGNVAFSVKTDAGSTKSTKFMVDGDGNVGLGTSGPQYLTHIFGGSDSSANNLLTVQSNGVASDGTLSTNIRLINSTATSSMHGAEIRAIRASGTSSDLSIRLYDTSGFFRDKVYIKGDGKVGVGTTNPSETLELSSVTANAAALKISRSTTLPNNLLLGTAGGDSFIRANGTASVYAQLIFESNNGTATQERARIDSSGRLLVGTSSSSAKTSAVLEGNSTTGTGDARLILALGDNAPADDALLGILRFTDTSHSTGNTSAADITVARDGGTWTTGTSMPGRLVFSTTSSGSSSPTERMRIGSAGAVTFTVPVTAGTQCLILNTTPYSPAFYVRGDGGIGNYSANNVNLSDRNTKKDISLAADTWNCIKAWEIVNYRYKDQPDDADLNLGVIAQQVAESCPEVITVFEEAKDDQPEKLGIKEQQMYWMAIKALQEAQVRIEALEAEVAALKAS